MPPAHYQPPPGYEITHPNRDKASSKATRAVVILLLLVSVALMVVISIGGWDTLEGAKAGNVFFVAFYLILAFFIARWARGLLPVAAATAMILLIFAAVSAPGWFDRDKDGFASPSINEDVLGLLTAGLIPVQLLLIIVAMQGFAQAWNVEVERRAVGSTRAVPQRA
jgi:hypothetical protein